MSGLHSGVPCGGAAAAITHKESEPGNKTVALNLDSEKPLIPLMEKEEGVVVMGDESANTNTKDEGVDVAKDDTLEKNFNPKVQVGRKQQRFESTNKCIAASTDCESHDLIIHQNSNTTSTDDSFKHFPEDLMRVILSLVPLKCLLYSARHVSKSWANTTQSCIRSKPPGLYIENINSEMGSYFLTIQDGSQSEKFYLRIPLRMGKIVATCNGILLLCDHFYRILTFAVNPVLKCFVRIPPLPTSTRPIKHRSTIAWVPCTTKFKLFLVDVPQNSVNHYVFYVLRIGIDNRWKEIARKKVINKKIIFLWSPVCSGDNDIYWITKDGVIVMDVAQETIIREYPLPPLNADGYLVGTFLWMRDRLSYIVLAEGTSTRVTYQVYTLNSDLGNWKFYLEMGPFDYTPTCGNLSEFDNNFYGANVDFRCWIDDQIIFEEVFFSRRVIKFPRWKNGHFCYNVKTRQLTKIEGIYAKKFKVWLHTNTLLSLPSAPTEKEFLL